MIVCSSQSSRIQVIPGHSDPFRSFIIAIRHKSAIAAIGIHDLSQLAVLLAAAVKDCQDNELLPNREPAVMLISYQIAFAGNGDFPMAAFYKDMYEYCKIHQDKEEAVVKEFDKPYTVT